MWIPLKQFDGILYNQRCINSVELKRIRIYVWEMEGRRTGRGKNKKMKGDADERREEGRKRRGRGKT